MIYLITIVLLLILIYVYDYREVQRMRMFWYLVMFVIFVCIAGLRYRIGNDSVVYENLYPDSPTLFQLGSYRMEATRFAPLFLVFQAFPRTISPDFTLMQIWHAFWVSSAIFYFVKRNTKHIFTVLLMFAVACYYLYMFEQIRESLAVSLFLLAWPYFRKRNWIAYYALCVTASLFHVSATMTFMLPLLLVPGIRSGFKFGKRTFVICICLVAFSLMINKMFFQYIMMLNLFEGAAERASNYANDDLGGGMLNVFGMISRFATWLLYPLLALIILHRESDKYSREQKSELSDLTKFVLCFIYFGLMSFGVEILTRFMNYFFFFTFIAMADCVFKTINLGRLKLQRSFVVWALIMLPMFGLEFKSYFSASRFQSYMLYYPYSSRLNPQNDVNRELMIIHMKG